MLYLFSSLQDLIALFLYNWSIRYKNAILRAYKWT